LKKLLYLKEFEEYKEYMDPNVCQYICEGEISTFESFEHYNLFAFDWYDNLNSGAELSRILVYMDQEDLFYICEEERAYLKVKALISHDQVNGKSLYQFFVGLLKNEMDYLEKFEQEVTDVEDDALMLSPKDYIQEIVRFRKELQQLKRYYEQLNAILDNLVANDNGLFSKDEVRHLAILENRTERFHHSVLNIRDYITQMREAYQSQIDIEQNKLMKIFTLIAAIFLPLGLLVGWYGMNFVNMPELTWRYGYPAFVGFSIILGIILLVSFKKKKWF
jgi:magnesium transporter